VLRGLLKFKTVGVLQITSSLFWSATTVTGIQLYGFDGAVICLLLYYSFYTLISIAAIWKHRLFFKINFCKEKIKRNIPVLQSMILPVFVMSFIEAPVLWVSQLMLAHYESAEAVGGMTVIMQIRNFSILIPTYFFNTFVAFAGDMNAKKQYTSYFNKFGRLMRLFALYGVIVAVTFSVFGELILSLYGKAYMHDNISLFLSNIGILPLIFLGLLRIDLIIQEHQKQLLYISIGWNCVWLLLFFITLKMGMTPLYAFFASQLIGITLQYTLYYAVYRKDKRRLCTTKSV